MWGCPASSSTLQDDPCCESWCRVGVVLLEAIRPSSSRGLGFTRRAPGSKPLGDLLVTHNAATVNFLQRFLDLPELPFLRLNAGGDGFRGQKGLGASRALRKGLQPTFNGGVTPYGKGCCHDLRPSISLPGSVLVRRETPPRPRVGGSLGVRAKPVWGRHPPRYEQAVRNRERGS